MSGNMGDKYRTKIAVLLAAVFLSISVQGCGSPDASGIEAPPQRAAVPTEAPVPSPEVEAVPAFPEWDGEHAWTELDGNEPRFDERDMGRTDAFEAYAPLDDLGRCGGAYANICPDLMPTEDRGEIGNVRPSGWRTVRYNGVVPGNYLYNRCHLIGFQLAGENDNERNLITGTRYLNVEGMLGFENQVADYVRETGNHVLYRVTPVYNGGDLVARGVILEALSVEDAGEGIRFRVFVHNVQPGIEIDYATGESRLADGIVPTDAPGEPRLFVLNTQSGKFHRPECRYAQGMSSTNRLELTQTVEKMTAAGYSPCGACRPDETGG